MSKLYFMNAGEFDPRAMLTFGVSVKEKAESIGFFGTGFKYAVAITLRLGGTIKITSKGSVYEFAASNVEIRGKTVELITCNGAETAFTTHLGTNWEPWMAYREFRCNALDENGEISETLSDAFDTVIEVDCRDIYDSHEKRHLFFIDPQQEPIYENAKFRIFEGHSHYGFYRGVAVTKIGTASLTYERKQHTDLTEDRMAKSAHWDFHYQIAHTIQACADSQLIRAVLSAPKDSFELELPFDKDRDVSPEFIQTCKDLMRTSAGISNSARECYFKATRAKQGEWPERELTPLQNRTLEKAKVFLLKINIPVDDFPIKIVDGLGDKVMGAAYQGGIYLSDIPFQLGTKQVASTLMEEWVHCYHGHKDFDYEMQNWLFNKVISLGEELAGDPL